MKRLVKLLNRPLFGTKVIPPGARVDAALFSEDEFPVYCPKCDYLLRGLPDGRCPECGTEFERGRLLVEQYVTQARERQWRSGWGRWVKFVVIFGMILVAAGAYGTQLAWKYYGPRAKAGGLGAYVQFVEWNTRVALAVMFLKIVILLILLAGLTVPYWRDRLKRRRVVDAIPPVEE